MQRYQCPGDLPCPALKNAAVHPRVKNAKRADPVQILPKQVTDPFRQCETRSHRMRHVLEVIVSELLASEEVSCSMEQKQKPAPDCDGGHQKIASLEEPSLHQQ